MDGRKLCTPDAQGPPTSPQLRPQEYPGSPQANPPRWCDGFHSSRRRIVFRCRTVDRDVEKRAFTVHNSRHPVGERWTTAKRPCGAVFLSTVCGFRLPTYPHAAELGGPPLGRLACGDDSGQLRCPQAVDSPNATFLWRNGSPPEPNRTAVYGRWPDGSSREAVGGPGGGRRATRSAPGAEAPGALRDGVRAVRRCAVDRFCGWFCGRGTGGSAAGAQLLMRLVSSVTWL